MKNIEKNFKNLRLLVLCKPKLRKKIIGNGDKGLVEKVNLYQPILRKNLTKIIIQLLQNQLMLKILLVVRLIEEILELEDIDPMQTSWLNRMDIRRLKDIFD